MFNSHFWTIGTKWLVFPSCRSQFSCNVVLDVQCCWPTRRIGYAPSKHDQQDVFLKYPVPVPGGVMSTQDEQAGNPGKCRVVKTTLNLIYVYIYIYQIYSATQVYSTNGTFTKWSAFLWVWIHMSVFYISCKVLSTACFKVKRHGSKCNTLVSPHSFP